MMAVKNLPDDASIYPIMQELRDCLCSQYPPNTLCQCVLLVGDSISGDIVGECGVAAYVQLSTAFPSEQNFPQADQVRTLEALQGFSIALGVLRTAPTGDGESAPDEDEMNEYSRLVMADMAAINRAISCCFTDKFDDANIQKVTWVPFPIDGGLGGGEWQIVVQEM